MHSVCRHECTRTAACQNVNFFKVQACKADSSCDGSLVMDAERDPNVSDVLKTCRLDIQAHVADRLQQPILSAPHVTSLQRAFKRPDIARSTKTSVHPYGAGACPKACIHVEQPGASISEQAIDKAPPLSDACKALSQEQDALTGDS
ncbi:hypothetical protein Efla_007730 [Eimeria flavescens]